MPWQRRHIWKCASEYIKVGAKPRHPLQSESSLSARRTALHVAPFPIPTDPGLVPVKVTLSELHFCRCSAFHKSKSYDKPGF